jgi:hypothetical protein
MNTEKELMDMKQILARMETKLDSVVNITGDHEERLRLLEGKNGKRWENLIGQIIALIVAAIVGYFLGKI